MVVGGGGWWPVVMGRPWSPFEAEEANSRVQIWGLCYKPSPLPMPPGPLKLRSIGNINIQRPFHVSRSLLLFKHVKLM